MILRFFLSPQEAEEEKTTNIFTLLFHTEDESIQLLCHSSSPTSDVSRSVLLGRQRVVTSAKWEGCRTFLKLEDITERDIVYLMGKRFLVIGCDRATARFLRSEGLTTTRILMVERSPLEDSQAGRSYKDGFVDELSHRPGEDIALTFFGEFVDEPAITGVTVSFAQIVEILFYPKDSSVEIYTRPFKSNGNTSRSSKYLKRQRIFKGDSINKCGIQSFGLLERPVLNIASSRDTSVSILDRQPSVSFPFVPLSLKDMILGQTIDICGRKIRLCDCNTFTMDYFRDNLQITQEHVSYQYLEQKFPEIRYKKEPESDQVPKKLPNSMVRRPVETKLRTEFANIVLRFQASLLSDVPQNRDREFIICVFLVDSSISVYEIPKLNSGRRCGTFLSRSLVYQEDEERFIEGKNFCIGESIVLNKHDFLVNGADEFTLNFLEEHPDEFPQSNYDICENLVKSLLDSPKWFRLEKCIRNSCSEEDKTLAQSTAVGILQSFFADEKVLTKHHHLTLIRRHLVARPLKISKAELSHLASLFIRRVNFSGISDLRFCLRNYDKDGTGQLSVSEVRRALNGTRVPLPALLVEVLLKSYASQEGLISYEQLVVDLDPARKVRLFCLPPCQLSEGELKSCLKFERVVDAESLIRSLHI